MKKLSRTIITRCNDAMIPDEITYSEANELTLLKSYKVDVQYKGTYPESMQPIIDDFNKLMDDLYFIVEKGKDAKKTGKYQELIPRIDSAVKKALVLKKSVHKVSEDDFYANDKTYKQLTIFALMTIVLIPFDLFVRYHTNKLLKKHGVTSISRAQFLELIDNLIHDLNKQKELFEKRIKKSATEGILDIFNKNKSRNKTIRITASNAAIYRKLMKEINDDVEEYFCDHIFLHVTELFERNLIEENTLANSIKFLNKEMSELIKKLDSIVKQASQMREDPNNGSEKVNITRDISTVDSIMDINEKEYVEKSKYRYWLTRSLFGEDKPDKKNPNYKRNKKIEAAIIQAVDPFILKIITAKKEITKKLIDVSVIAVEED